VIFESKACRGTGGRKAELIDDFFPQFIVGDSLATAFFANGFVKFEEIELLSTNLWYFDLGDPFRAPIFGEVFLKFTFLF